MILLLGLKSWQEVRLDKPRTIFVNNLGEKMPENEVNMEECKTDTERSNDFPIF